VCVYPHKSYVAVSSYQEYYTCVDASDFMSVLHL